MPAKRCKASEPASAPAPKKRITRSAAKADASTAQVPDTNDLKAERKTLKGKGKPPVKGTTSTAKTTTTTSKSKSSKPKAESKHEEDTTQGTTTASNVTPFTVNSSTVKSPIQCHAYAPPNPHTLSSHTLVFTHGAGGALSAPAVVNFCTGYATHFPVRAFQGSMNLASRVKGFHACLEDLRASKELKKTEAKTVVLGGRSMGARAAVIAATEILKEQEEGFAQARVQLIPVSYPLKGPKDVRDEILISLPERVEVLFVIGDSDGMCPLDLLESVRGKMKAKSQLVLVKDADHGMHVRPAKREKEVGEETGRLAAGWVEGKMNEDVVYVGEGKDE